MRDNWVNKKIREIGKVQTGSTPKTSNNDNFGDYIPFVKPSDFFKNGSLDYTNQGLSEIGLNQARLVDRDSVLMVCIGATIGKVGFTEKEVTTNQQINSLTPLNGDCSKFLFYQMLTQDFQQKVLNSSGQATLPIINKTKWSNLSLYLPPIPQQKQIVTILDEAFEGIDRAIANTEKNLANARELFESYLNAIFTQKGDGWGEKKLGELCKKVEYGSSAKSLVEGKIPVLRMGNIQNGVIDWSNLVYTIDQEEIDKYLLKYNDVLFNRTNSDVHVGKTAIYKGEMPAIFAGYLIRIHRKDELIDAEFLNFYLNSYTAREYGRSIMGRSVNQANINGTKLKDYPISLPSLSIQKQIVEKLSFLRTETQRLEAIYRQKLAALNELKQSILQKAFTGELTADNANQVKKTAKEVNAA